jgi:endo-1,4-beta-xylanase
MKRFPFRFNNASNEWIVNRNRFYTTILSILILSDMFSLSATEAFQETVLPQGGKLINYSIFESGVSNKNSPTGSIARKELTGEAYDKVLEIDTVKKGNPWDLMTKVPFREGVKQGDVLLMRVVARCISTINESGFSNAPFSLEPDWLWGEGRMAEREKITNARFNQALTIQTDGRWKEFFVAVKAPMNIDANELVVVGRSGAAIQTIQVAKLEVYNYGQNYDITSLPTTSYTYAGRGPDAPWRKEAEERIRKHRMGTIRVHVTGKNKQPVAGEAVAVTMQRHAYDFGAAFRGEQAAASHPDSKNYKKNLLKFFNFLSLTNELKWEPMVGEWGDKHSFEKTTRPLLAWFQEQGIPSRGHALIWGSRRYTPEFIRELLLQEPIDCKKLREATMRRVRDAVKLTMPYFNEWDVVNESLPEGELMDACGYDLMADFFKEAKRVNPQAVCAINEYAIITVQEEGTEKQKAYEERIQLMLDMGAPIDVIGVQGHFPAIPESPAVIYKHLDRFAQFGIPLRVTELDISSSDHELNADFIRDFHIIAYSHPMTVGVQFWEPFLCFYYDFKDYMNNRDHYPWEETPAAKAYRKLVQETWWTNEAGVSNKAGIFEVQAYLGTHKIVADGKEIVVELKRGGELKEVTIDVQL